MTSLAKTFVVWGLATYHFHTGGEAYMQPHPIPPAPFPSPLHREGKGELTRRKVTGS